MDNSRTTEQRSQAIPKVSLVIPVYNEEESLPLLFERLDAFLQGFDRTMEIILVDDGSRDASLSVMREALRSRPHFRVLKLRSNVGQTPAMAAGLEAARGEVILFMDADLQNDPEDIPRLLDQLEEGYDLVSGWRKDRKDKNLTRKIPSKIANALIGIVTGVRVHDYGCTLKAYRARIVKPLKLYSDMHRFLPALCSISGARICEIPVKHHPRLLGKSKYGLNRIFKVLADLVVVKMIITFADRPMHYFGILSALFLALCGITSAVWVINLTQAWRLSTVVLPSLITLFFVSFLYFLFMGLLADLIVRVSRRNPVETAIAGMQELADE
ncbi:MAG TPA: glycosyltransferase family 2 protein [Planctomycetota bacterium]|nr:glycosyltransferase family 2 protein [Planctomycetota bacterium]